MEEQERIEAYVDGSMAGNELAGFEAELASNAELLEAVEAERQLRDALTVAGKMQVLESLEQMHQEVAPAKSGRSMLRIAATIALVIGLGAMLFFVINNGNNLGPQELASAYYQEPDWNTLRGAADSTNSWDAIKLEHDAGNYNDAIRMLEEQIAVNPQGMEAYYLLGHVHYASGAYNAAIEPLQAVVNSGSLLAQLAHWQLALVYLAQDKPALALEHLTQVQQGGGEIAATAGELIDRLQ